PSPRPATRWVSSAASSSSMETRRYACSDRVVRLGGRTIRPCCCAHSWPDPGLKGEAMAISSPPRRGGQAAPQRQRGLITALVLALVAVLVLAAVVVASLARGGLPGSGVQGTGVAATQSRALPTFSRLDLAGSNNVIVAVGGRQSVVVHADSN